MPLINTQYDGKIGKIFVLRGDVGYASSTDTLFDIISDSNSKNSIDGYKVGFKYNVLRDKGVSKVVLYDDDEVLAEYDWDSDDGETFVGVLNNHTTVDPTTCLYLSYGKEHNLTMRYKGNDKCMKSKSRKVRVYEPIPPQFVTTVSINNVTVGSNNTIYGTVEVLVGGVETESCSNVSVEIHLDGELIGTVITDSDPSTVEFTITDVSDGSHVIGAYVVPSDSINPAQSFKEVSVGYNVIISSYPSPFILGIDNDIVVSLTDYNGVPMANETINLGEYTATTNAKGEATFTLSSIEDGSYIASYGSYVSDPITIETYTPEFGMSIGKNPITIGESTTVQALLTQPIANVPIRISKRYAQQEQEIEHYDLITNEYGVASVNAYGNCSGLYDYIGSIGELTHSITLNDAIIWYDVADGELNGVGTNKIDTTNCSKTFINQGLLLKEATNTTPRLNLTTFPKMIGNGKFECIFSILPNDCESLVIQRNSTTPYSFNISLGRLQTVRLSFNNNKMDVYVDGIKINDSPLSFDYPMIRITMPTTQSKSSIALIKNLKFYESR